MAMNDKRYRPEVNGPKTPTMGKGPGVFPNKGQKPAYGKGPGIFPNKGQAASAAMGAKQKAAVMDKDRAAMARMQAMKKKLK